MSTKPELSDDEQRLADALLAHIMSRGQPLTRDLVKDSVEEFYYKHVEPLRVEVAYYDRDRSEIAFDIYAPQINLPQTN